MCNDVKQAEKFKKAARELGVDLDEDKLKDALRRMKDHPPQKDDDQSSGKSDS